MNENPDVPPFKNGDVVEVIKTRGPARPPQQLRLTRLWWGTESGHWMCVGEDTKTGKEYHTFADTLKLAPAAPASPAVPPAPAR